MRKIIMALAVIICLSDSCKKSNNTINPPPGGDSISVSSISPLISYPGDVITITGKGFDADMNKDTVWLGIIVNQQYTNGFYQNVRPRTKLISASATQLKFTTDSGLALYPDPATKVGLMIKTTSHKYTTPDNPLQFKTPLNFGFFSVDPYQIFCTHATYAGDSIYVSGAGFYKPCTVYINGKPYPFVFDSDNTTKGRSFIPVGYFGETDPPPGCDLVVKKWEVKVVNGDGKSQANQYNYYPAPNTQVTGISLNAPSYSLASTNYALMTFTGYALRGDMKLQISGIDKGTNTTFTEEINVNGSGFPSTIVQQIDFGAFPVPSSQGADYNIAIKTGSSGSYGFPVAGFTLVP